MASEGENLYPIAVLIDELKNDDVNLRLNSMERLRTISVALGPDRTREELIPFLTEMIDDEEDEVLLAMAEQLNDRFVELVGGSSHASALLVPLETLCDAEEPSVREKATASLRAISTRLSNELVQELYLPLIQRMARRDWVSSRAAATGLFHALYPNVDPRTKAELRELYNQLCHDSSPLVRRAACTNLGTFAEAVEKDAIKTEILPMFVALSQDDQDSVRLLTVDAAVALGKQLTQDECVTYLLPTLRTSTQDRSWRVRYMVANKFDEICKIMGSRVTRSELVNAFVRLCGDTEAEVRTAAAHQVSKVSSMLTPEQTMDFLESVKTLTQDGSQHVRSALASDIMGLAPLLGRDRTLESLLPLYLRLLKDEFHEVRLNVIAKLEDVNKVIGVELLSQSLLPSIVELSQDRQWRVRLAIIDYIPLLATELGVRFFDEKLCDLCMTWLGDTVYSVREATTANLRKVVETFGSDWAQHTLIPKLSELADNPNYLHRMTLLFTISTLASVMGPDGIVASLLPLALRLVGDNVPNVRFNVAKTLQTLIPLVEPQVVQSSIKPSLIALNEDSDVDVKFFASQALQLC